MYSFVNFCRLIGVVFARARKIASGFKSIPQAFLPSNLLSTRAVPEPQNISQTRLFSSEKDSTHELKDYELKGDEPFTRICGTVS